MDRNEPEPFEPNVTVGYNDLNVSIHTLKTVYNKVHILMTTIIWYIHFVIAPAGLIHCSLCTFSFAPFKTYFLVSS